MKTYSTSAVANLLGVAVGSVANWIDKNHLRAARTPGGHRRIAADDLVAFLRKQGFPIPSELQPSPPKILIVDDEPKVARLFAAQIAEKHPDYEILVAHDGFAAGELVASARPNVVILDLKMPGMDGFEVCRRIKSQKSLKATEVIAITGYRSAKAEKQILACGARVCLEKPLDRGALLKELASALGLPGEPSAKGKRSSSAAY